MVHHIPMEQTTMTNNEYHNPILFRELEDGTEFKLLLNSAVFIKVSPQEVTQSDGSKRTVNAMSASKIFSTWVMDVEMAYIKE